MCSDHDNLDYTPSGFTGGPGQQLAPGFLSLTIHNIQVLGTILFEGGYQLNVAQNGQQSLDLIARAKPDLILLEIMMPVMDGFETSSG